MLVLNKMVHHIFIFTLLRVDFKRNIKYIVENIYRITAPRSEVVSSQHRAPACSKLRRTCEAARRILRRQHGGVLRPERM